MVQDYSTLKQPISVRIIKTEHGLAVPISEDMLSAAGFKGGGTVNLYVRSGEMEVADPLYSHYHTKELVATITPENCHPEIRTGPPRGNEVW